jgi:signal transduction histidine kinase
MKFTPQELQPLQILEGLPDALLTWLADHGTKLVLERGDRMFTRGEPADFMFVVVKGRIERFEEIGGQWLVVATTGRGEVTGMLPYSRMIHYPGHTVATELSEVLRVNKGDFDDLLRLSHTLGQRLVAEMSKRVRGDVRLEQQWEKMMALGRLSAGLAHELNNPIAAIRRTVANLSEQLNEQTVLMTRVTQQPLKGNALQKIEQLGRAAHRSETPGLSPIERSEREEQIADWLGNRGVFDAEELAGLLTHSGLGLPDLERFAAEVPETALHETLAWVAGNLEIDRMVSEISSAAERVSELVASVKIYSHMDRSSEHKPTDVRIGLDNTLTMFGHRLKGKNIRVQRSYPQELPSIPANAGELNQVWTNLIDNAIDAVTEGGELRIEVGSDEWCVGVKIIDDGTGIPEEIRHRIFDPFFTTKDVGQGTGLGLDIARRIVNTHRGQIEVRSQPGRTEMFVRLPTSTTGGITEKET